MRRILLASLVLAFALSKLAFSAAAADTTPPTLISAVRHSTNLFEIFLTFSERMDTNTTLDVANYTVKTGNTENQVFDIYTPANQKLTTNVIVSVGSEVAMNKDWVVIVKNVADTNGNVIVPITTVVTTVEELLISGSEWRFSDGGAYPEPNSRFFDTAWAQPDPDFDLRFTGVTPFYRGWTPPGVATPICCWNNVTDTEFTSTTYYYRQWVPITGSLFNGTFNMRMTAADGAVVYINGKEVYRTNIAATVLQPVYTTFASGTGTAAKLGATGGRVITLPGGAFVPGPNNVVAVEVHSRIKTTTISGFDFELIHTYTNRLTGAIKITRQPQDITVTEGTGAKFDVQHEGNPPYKYEWSKGATKIIGATNRILNLDLVTLADNNALYSVKVTGGTGATTPVTSSNAVLHVVADTNAPTLLSALLDDAGQSITINFSERMKVPAATTIGNYTLTNLQGETLGISAITNADDSFKSFAITPAGPLKASTRYFIVPKNLTDNAAKANALAAGSVVSVGATFTLVEMESSWHYYADGTNPPVGATWNQKSFNDSEWSTGNSLFGVDDSILPLPFATPLPLLDTDGKAIITYYFRRTFEGGGPTNGLSLLLSHITDDGIVIWLNGSIAYRFGGLAGTPKYDAFASSVDNAVLLENIKLPITNLVAGVNQLAVELHQSSATSSDAAFAMQLDQSIPSVVSVVEGTAPKLTIVKSGTTGALISWTATTGFTLQSATKLAPTADWTSVAGAGASSYTATLSAGSPRYYRLIKQ